MFFSSEFYLLILSSFFFLSLLLLVVYYSYFLFMSPQTFSMFCFDSVSSLPLPPLHFPSSVSTRTGIPSSSSSSSSSSGTKVSRSTRTNNSKIRSAWGSSWSQSLDSKTQHSNALVFFFPLSSIIILYLLLFFLFFLFFVFSCVSR